MHAYMTDIFAKSTFRTRPVIMHACTADMVVVPMTLIDNIAVNGIMIVPIGPADDVQVMKKLTKIGSRLEVEDLFEIRTQGFISGVSRAI